MKTMFHADDDKGARMHRNRLSTFCIGKESTKRKELKWRYKRVRKGIEVEDEPHTVSQSVSQSTYLLGLSLTIIWISIKSRNNRNTMSTSFDKIALP